MKTIRLGTVFCRLICGGLLTVCPWLQAGQYFQDFDTAAVGATNFHDGSILFSTALGTVACVTNSPYYELQLTETNGKNVQSAFELPDLDSNTAIYAFSVKWNANITGGFPAAGDGFSFNFGLLSSFNLVTNNTGETGYGEGLCLSVRTAAGTNSGIYLLANGAVLAALTNNPALQWGTNSSARHFWEVDWNISSGITVRLDSQGIFTNVATIGFMPESGDVFVWAARSDTNTEEVRLDNIIAATGGNLVQLPAGPPYFANEAAAGTSVTNAFDGNNETYWETLIGPSYLGATIVPPSTVLAYALTSGVNGATTPQNWTLEGSTNSGVNWFPCSTGAGNYLNGAETRAWLTTNSTAYTAYGLFFSTPGGQSDATIGELRFYALSLFGAPAIGWRQLPGASDLAWTAIASSADGTRLAATANGSGIYISTNSGTIWTQAGNTASQSWGSIASSANGLDLAAAQIYGEVFTNTYTGGQNVFFASSTTQAYWNGIASSSSGVDLAAVVNGGGIYVSTNSGYTWTPTTASNEEWQCLASSANGTTLAAGGISGTIFVSTNSGSTWVPTSATNQTWNAIACSADGAKMAAASQNDFEAGSTGGVFVSTNSGSTWRSVTGLPVGAWTAIASSADGTRLAAALSGGSIYLSANSGNTWTNSSAPGKSWISIASSADGSKLMAAVNGGGIYTYSLIAPPLPSLHVTLAGGYPAFMWSKTNAGNFLLQENTNLLTSNWVNVSRPVTTNGSSYQVTDLPSGSGRFYRLAAPAP